MSACGMGGAGVEIAIHVKGCGASRLHELTRDLAGCDASSGKEVPHALDGNAFRCFLAPESCLVEREYSGRAGFNISGYDASQHREAKR